MLYCTISCSTLTFYVISFCLSFCYVRLIYGILFCYVIPQTVRYGVLSWKNGTRRAGWVARGFEPGARGPDGLHAALLDEWQWHVALRLQGLA